MSLAVQPIETFQVLDPCTRINSDRQYAILRGGSRVTYKSINSTSYNDSTFSFTAPPPNPGVIVDRKLALKAPTRVTFVGTAPPGQNLLQTGFDAPRKNCLASVMNSIDASLNNSATSINISDVIHVLSRYNTGALVRDGELSIGLQMEDQYQRYEDGTGTVRNCLAGYADVYPEIPRGAFPYTSVVNTNTDAVVEFTPSEFIYMSPFAWGHPDRSGFIGLQTMDFTFNFGNLTRIWSHSTNSGSTFTADPVVTFYGQPSLLFKYITPSVLSPLPMVSIYPFFKVQRYPTSPGIPIAPNATTTIGTQNIQLQSIPCAIYACARKQKIDRGYTDPDTFFRINSTSVNWNNNSGLLASASFQDIFRFCKKNGLNMSYPQFYGTTNSWAGATNEIIGTIGSPVKFVPGLDFALLPDEAPGLLGTFQLQMDFNVTNVNQVETITPELMLITIEEGTWTIMQNQSVSQIGVISRQNVIDSVNRPMLDYSEISDLYGGNFWSGLKHFGERVWNWLKGAYKKVAPVVKKGIDVATKIAPLVAPLIGLGEGGVTISGASAYSGGRRRRRRRRGGALVGGEGMSRAQLRRALM